VSAAAIQRPLHFDSRPLIRCGGDVRVVHENMVARRLRQLW
jgi:hypothetical protein